MNHHSLLFNRNCKLCNRLFGKSLMLKDSYIESNGAYE